MELRGTAVEYGGAPMRGPEQHTFMYCGDCAISKGGGSFTACVKSIDQYIQQLKDFTHVNLLYVCFVVDLLDDYSRPIGCMKSYSIDLDK
jgi:hypothetical protein